MTLDLTDVSLTLGDGADEVRALDHVDLHVAAGEVIAVVGPSGSGKSSLLAVAGAMLTPTSGTILVDGVDLGAIDDAARTRLRRERVGFVFQGVNLLPSLTALEQLLLLPHLTACDRRPNASAPPSCSNGSGWRSKAPTAGRTSLLRRRAPARRHRPGVDGPPCGGAGRRADLALDQARAAPRSPRCWPTRRTPMAWPPSW
ncbi:MAG: ATP-binding cassette domain-containing protein [Acidimicrobiales bacterium]